MNDVMVSIHEKHCIGDNGNVETDRILSDVFWFIEWCLSTVPGVKSTVDTDGNIPNFDPRLRPWYIAASKW